MKPQKQKMKGRGGNMRFACKFCKLDLFSSKDFKMHESKRKLKATKKSIPSSSSLEKHYCFETKKGYFINQ
jgi:hypothetical protein